MKLPPVAKQTAEELWGAVSPRSGFGVPGAKNIIQNNSK